MNELSPVDNHFSHTVIKNNENIFPYLKYIYKKHFSCYFACLNIIKFITSSIKKLFKNFQFLNILLKCEILY